jgi:hypothetical protein
MSYSTSNDQTAVSSDMASQVPAMMNQASAIPDLMRIGAIPTNTAIEIDTDILDPVVRSDTFCRFQFQNKGILHSHSKICVRLANAPADGDAFFPLGIGVHSLVERCRLMIGTQTISEIDDYNHYMGYKSIFMSGDHQKERESVTSGRCINHSVYYADGDNASNGGTSDSSASFIGLDVGTEVIRSTSGSTAVQGNVLLKPYMTTNSTLGGPEYQIALADLFPFLYTNQLPLYMINEPVTVELTFAPALNKRVSGNAGTSYSIDTTSLQLIADYQYFPQEIMESYARSNSTMSFTYVDYRMAKRTVSSSGTAGSEVSTGQTIMNIGGAGRIVSKVIAMLSRDGADAELITNNYHSYGPRRDYDTAGSGSNQVFNGELTANIKYNNLFLYPIDIKNSARLFYQLTQAEGMVPHVTRDEYSFQGEGITPYNFEGITQSADSNGLPNHFFYQAYHLNRNERINSRGIEYYFDYNALQTFSGSSDTYTLRTYVEILKTATITNGMVSTMLA